MAEHGQTETALVPVPGGELFVEVSGRGPAVVLIHAGICDARMWDGQVRSLTERYTVVRYDCRGFGRSRTEPVAFSNRHDLVKSNSESANRELSSPAPSGMLQSDIDRAEGSSYTVSSRSRSLAASSSARRSPCTARSPAATERA